MTKKTKNAVRFVTQQLSGSSSGHERRDLESGVVYLRFTAEYANIFSFVTPFERHNERHLIVIPNVAFNLGNYHKYLPILDLQYFPTLDHTDEDLNSSVSVLERMMVNMDHVISPLDLALNCFGEDDSIFATDWTGSIGQEYNGESIHGDTSEVIHNANPDVCKTANSEVGKDNEELGTVNINSGSATVRYFGKRQVYRGFNGGVSVSEDASNWRENLTSATGTQSAVTVQMRKMPPPFGKTDRL